jgi:DNA-binding transcriptional MocR family regulator
MLVELDKIKSTKKIEWITPNGGMSIWVDLLKDSKKITEIAKVNGIFFQHESSMDYLNSFGTHLRIGFAGVNEKEIKEGLGFLKTLL